MGSSEEVTRGIRVEVESRYLPERSNPAAKRWLFGYRIRITNHGSETVRLLSRHWVITDANGEVQEVRGDGVVGRQPVLAPDESFEYTSGCPLRTPFGTMHGSYEMALESGERFDVGIAPFTLNEPHAIN